MPLTLACVCLCLCVQGTLLKRHRIAKRSVPGAEPEYYTWEDLVIGNEITIYGRCVFTLHPPGGCVGVCVVGREYQCMWVCACVPVCVCVCLLLCGLPALPCADCVLLPTPSPSPALRTYRIVDCDDFTRSFFAEKGAEQPAPEAVPVDAAAVRTQVLAQTGPKAEKHGACVCCCCLCCGVCGEWKRV